MQWMVNGVSGRSSVNVARPVVKGRKLDPVPAPTPHPQEVARTARGKANTPRAVTVKNAQVWRLSIFYLNHFKNIWQYM